MASWLRSLPNGELEISVLVQPRASRSRVVGEHGGMLKVQLAAPPVDGEANAALIELFSDLLDIPRRQVALASGEASRRKHVRVSGVDAAAVEAVMNAL